jgi:putative DNA primase/helicase
MSDERRILPPPELPMKVARTFANECFVHSTGPVVLRSWRGHWWIWRTTHWVELEHRAVRAAAYEYTEHAVYLVVTKEGEEQRPWAPNRYKIANLLEALAAVCHLRDEIAPPAWLDNRPSGVIVACANGLFDVERRELLPHDPRFFNQVAVPFDYDRRASEPKRWLGFLDELWPNQDGNAQQNQIAALAQWFGYVLSGRTALQKIFLIVGPTRAGKGVITRLLGAMVGPENVAGPTLSSLGANFGLAPLVGKPLAVVSDARLNGRDSNTVVERLLSVSGEDQLTVDIKYQEQWTGKLPTRFMLLSNELPQLGDASAAIAGRFETLLLTRSWLGKEDRTLEPELRRELPGVLNWALAGLSQLESQGSFTRAAEAEEAYRALVDLASPVKAFVRDRCLVGHEHQVAIDDLYAAWKEWAEDNGHGRKTKQTLGRDLRAALPLLRVVRPREDGERVRLYSGIGLQEKNE